MKHYIFRLSSFSAPTRVDWLVYFGIFFILHIPGILNFYSNNGSDNAYLLFAESLLNGKLTLPPMSSYGDMILFKGNVYLPYPPLPAFLLLPFVALFGAANVNTVLIALVISCVNLYLVHKILVKLKVSEAYFPWLTIGFFFGTGYWYALFTSHHVYAFAHITSCMFVLLFLNELFHKQRWWLVGLLIGCSFFTRQFTLFYLFFAVGYMLYHKQQRKESFKLSAFCSLLAPVAAFILIYLFYNYYRFGNALDTGYRSIVYIGDLKDRVEQYGVFNIRYFLFNVYSLFIKGFNIEFTGSGLLRIKDMDLWGTSLLSASPFLIASLKSKWPRLLKIGAWLSVSSIALGALFYHNNGFHQVNTMRFSLDFLPLLFLLCASGSKSIPTWLFKGMIVYSVSLNILAFLIHALYE